MIWIMTFKSLTFLQIINNVRQVCYSSVTLFGCGMIDLERLDICICSVRFPQDGNFASSVSF